jgi:hypothetical protein
MLISVDPARDQVITGDGGGPFLADRPPPKLPRPNRQEVGRRGSNGDDARHISTSHRCFSPLCPPAGGP